MLSRTEHQTATTKLASPSGPSVLLLLFPVLLLVPIETSIDRAYWAILPFAIFMRGSLLNQRGRAFLSYAEWILLCLVLSAALSFIFSPYKNLSTVPTLYFIGYYLLLLFLSIRCKTIIDISYLLIGSTVAYFIVLVRFSFSSQLVANRLTSEAGGLLDQPNAAGAMAGAAVVCSLVHLRLKVGDPKAGAWALLTRLCAYCCLSAGMAVLLLSASRGSTAAVSSFILIWLIPVVRRAPLWRQAVVFTGALAVVAVSWARVTDLFVIKRFWYLAWELGLAQAPPEGRFDDSIAIRDSLKEIAVGIFENNPIFGTGLGTFGAFSNYVYSHTTFYEILYSLGAVGTVCAVLFWGSLLSRPLVGLVRFRQGGEFPWLLAAVAVFLAVQGLTLPLVTSRTHMPLLLILLAGARLNASSFKHNDGGRVRALAVHQ